ncbi:hypothetical protein B566_EDAN017624 [Ephemera danica]|nr:hypothetical protein B566_EDAN017624 [Ephemera danica]
MDKVTSSQLLRIIPIHFQWKSQGPLPISRQSTPTIQTIEEDNHSTTSEESTYSRDFDLEPGAEEAFEQFGPRYSRRERKIWEKIDALVTPLQSHPIFPPRSTLPKTPAGYADWPVILMMPFTWPGTRPYPWTEDELQDMQNLTYMERIRYAAYCHLSPRERRILETSPEHRQKFDDYLELESSSELYLSPDRSSLSKSTLVNEEELIQQDLEWIRERDRILEDLAELFDVEGKWWIMSDDEQPDPQGNPPYNASGAVARDIRPGDFSGEPGENIAKYLQKFQKIALANNWQDADCYRILPCYLNGAAADFFTLWEGTALAADRNWAGLRTAITNAFQLPGEKDLITVQLRNKFQGKHEPVQAYYFAVLNLCRQLDPVMTDLEKVKHLIRGLQPELIAKIGTMEANTPEQLMKNIQKYQELQVLTEKVGKLGREEDEVRNHNFTRGSRGFNTRERERDYKEKERERDREYGHRQQPQQASARRDNGRSGWHQRQARRSEQARDSQPPRYEREGEKERVAPTEKIKDVRYKEYNRGDNMPRGNSKPSDGRGGPKYELGGIPSRTTQGQVVCHYCGKSGHMIRFCRQRISDQEQNSKNQ